MNRPILILLILTVAGLWASGAATALLPPRGRPVAMSAGTGLHALAALLATGSLLVPGSAERLVLPIGLPGGVFAVELDPLSACFTLMVALAGLSICLFAAGAGTPARPGALAGIPCVAAAALFVVLAADAIGLALGLALASGSIWVMRQLERQVRPAAAGLIVPLCAAGAVVLSCPLLVPGQAGLTFAEIRAALPDAGRATAAAWVAIGGLGALIGLAPSKHWPAPDGEGGDFASAVLAGCVVPAAIYALVRLLLDLNPEASPALTGAPLLLAGALAILRGGLRGMREPELGATAAWNTPRHVGALALALGLVELARGYDLAGLAALAFAAAILLAAIQALCGTMTMLAVAAIRAQAGSLRLDRLGGLAQRMPITSLALCIGLAAGAGLPLLPGFAALYLLVQAVLAAPHFAGPLLALVLIGLVGLVAAGSALAAVALLRVIGVACLGRTRIPRAAGAEEVPRPARLGLMLPAFLALLLGITPGPALRLLAGPLPPRIAGPLRDHAGWLSLGPAGEGAGYMPLPLMLLLAGVAGTVVLLRYRFARADRRLVPIWQDGFAPPPRWLPFGDPATQWDGEVPRVTPDWRLGGRGRGVLLIAEWLRGFRATGAWGAPATAVLIVAGLLALTLVRPVLP